MIRAILFLTLAAVPLFHMSDAYSRALADIRAIQEVTP